MPVLKVLDLFSGIGGFSLGLEATGGFQTQAFVECDPFCRAVLKKHWPHLTCYPDVRGVTIAPESFDVLCGGFPCQDVSTAGKTGPGQSLLGDRSGMWWEYYRLISEGQPTWVIIENVKNLVNQGLSVILRQLADLGYDAEWHIIRAADVGFPHIRERIWIVAHHSGHGVQGHSPFPLQRLQRVPWGENGRRASNWLNGWPADSPRICRGGHGIPRYVDRIRSIGNSVVPQITYELGQAILEALNGPTV